MTNSLVLTETDGGITVVTLNRPEALNALSRALRGAIVETFERLRADPATEVVILTGAGRAFTAGIDLKELGGERDADTAANSTTANSATANSATANSATANSTAAVSDRDLSRVFAELGRPIIGAINGYAITGGFEIALMCDFLIASTQAKFADTHARVGVVPGWGLSQKLPRLIGINRAKELSLTGNYLSAERAYEWGLVNRVVEPAELLPTCKALARDILTTDPATRSEIRRIMDQGWNATLGEGMAIELDANRAHARRELTPEKVAARRKGIQERGRNQSR